MSVALKKWVVFILVNMKSLNGLAIGLVKLILRGGNMKKVKKVFHSFKELEEEWQRQGIVKPDDERIKNFRLVSSDNMGKHDSLEKFIVLTKK